METYSMTSRSPWATSAACGAVLGQGFAGVEGALRSAGAHAAVIGTNPRTDADVVPGPRTWSPPV